MPYIALIFLATLILAGCGGGGQETGGGDTETDTTTTTQTSAPHTTAVDGVTCGELEDIVRRNEVAGELADEFVGTLTARTLLVPTFSAALSGSCDGASAGDHPVPELVEQADVAERRTMAQGGSFIDHLLDVTSGVTNEDEPTETVAQGSVVEQANAACDTYRSLISRELNDAVSEFAPYGEGAAGHLGRRVEQLRADLADVVSQGGPDATLIESFSAGLQQLADIGTQIAEAESPGSETDATPLENELRARAGELEQSMPEATLFSCRSLVTVFP